MSQKNKNLYKVLSNTYMYSFFQRIMSGTSFRSKIIKKYITRENVKVLDLGCGPAEIIESLPNVKYYGFDINPIYINYAKKKYKNKGIFFCKKISLKDTKRLPKFDYVLLLGILHHLDDDEIKKLMIIIKRVLKKRGNVITEDPIYIKNQNPIAKLIISLDRGENVRNKNEYINLIRRHFKKIKTYIYHQKFIPYTWYVMNFKN